MKNKLKILFVCVENSCRSQMAEGYLKSFNPEWDVVSAGTEPSGAVHPNAIIVMKEEGVDLNQSHPKSVDEFLDQEFDYVITVCGGAKESCPMFTGKVKNNIHIGFDDPAEAEGSEEFILSEFIRIRDEIKRDFRKFYDSIA
jgi:arsenate reductase